MIQHTEWDKFGFWPIILALLTGGLLRFQGLDWDHGLMLHPDERNIAYGAAKLSFPDKLIPDFHAYNGLSLYLPRLLYAIFSFDDGDTPLKLEQVITAGRLISATFSTVTLLVVWFICSIVLNRSYALFAVFLFAFSPGLIQAAHFATTESGLVLCLCLLVLISTLRLNDNLTANRFAVLSGLVLAFGFGLKTSALAFGVVPAVAMLQKGDDTGHVWAFLRTGIVISLVFLPLALVTSPQLVMTPGDYLATMRFEGGVVSGAEDVFWTFQFAHATSVVFELSQLPWLVGPVAAPLGLAGTVVLLLRSPGTLSRQTYLIGLAIFSIIYAVLIFTWYAKFIRYLILLVPILLLGTAVFCAALSERLIRRMLIAACLTFTVLAGIVQASHYQKTDPRLEAWRWLVPNLSVGQVVLIEPNDVGPPFPKPNAGDVRIDVLPLLEESSQRKMSEIARLLTMGDWLVVASRRHHRVLPYMQPRFGFMCGYFNTLFSGQLGYVPVKTFRRFAWPAFLDPAQHAEETFTVFDSPTVIVFKKVTGISHGRLEEKLLKPQHCS